MFDLVKYYMNKGKGGNSGSSSNEYDLTGVSVASFAAASLMGLGLLPTPGNGTPFNNLVNQTSQFLLSILPTAANGLVQLVSPVPGKFYVDRDILTSVKNWLFTSDTIVSVITPNLMAGVSLTVAPGASIAFIADCSTFLFRKAGSSVTYVLAVASQPNTSITGSATQGRFAYPGSGRVDLSDGVHYWAVYSTTAYNPANLRVFPSDMGYLAIANAYVNGDVDGFVYPSGISPADVVPEVGTNIEINYIDWAELEKQLNSNPTQDPEDPNQKTYHFWPIWWPEWLKNPTAVPSDPASDADDISQSDIWTEGSDPSWNPDENIENKNSSPILWWGKTK